MTPSVVASTKARPSARTRSVRPPATRPRRAWTRAVPPTLRMPAHAGATGAVVAAPLGLRVARRAVGVSDARFLDRLIRGRVWIVLIGAMLIALVFLQLSLLSLNAGIGENLQRAQSLERQNAALRTDVSRMDAGQRVQDLAAKEGLLMPPAGARRYVKAGSAPASEAARRITPPGATGSEVAAPSAAPTPTPAPGSAAPHTAATDAGAEAQAAPSPAPTSTSTSTSTPAPAPATPSPPRASDAPGPSAASPADGPSGPAAPAPNAATGAG